MKKSSLIEQEQTSVSCYICGHRDTIFYSDGRHNFCWHILEGGSFGLLCMDCKIKRVFSKDKKRRS